MTVPLQQSLLLDDDVCYEEEQEGASDDYGQSCRVARGCRINVNSDSEECYMGVRSRVAVTPHVQEEIRGL